MRQHHRPIRQAISSYLTLLSLLLLPVLVSAQQQLQYQLQVKANLAQKTFSVAGTLSFLTDSTTSDSVEIVISRHATPPQLQLLTAAVTVARIDTAPNAAGDMAYHIRFTHRTTPGTRLEFRYAYERGHTPAFQYYLDSTFCMAGGYGSAWYPQVSSRSSDGSMTYTKGTGSIAVTTDQSLTAIMAASTVQTSNNGGLRTYTFRYTRPDILSLYIGRYTKQENKQGLPVTCYTMGSAANGKAIAEKTVAVMQYLTTLFGPLDIPDFSIIEFPDAIAEQTGIGGASLMGGILMPANALRQFNYALFGHELSHQWWGNKIIARGQRGADMLSEGLAQYGSLQVIKHFDSSNAFLYRTTGYPGYIPDQSGLGYLKNVVAGNDEPLTRLTGANGHALGDSKGFLVLELLAQTVGHPAFHQALRHIGERYSHSGISWEQFQQEITTAHGSDLEWFFRQWFERTGAPSWATTWAQDKQGLTITITQQDSLYRLSPEVEITTASGRKIIKTISLQDRVTRITIPLQEQVTAVTTDPAFRIIHWDATLTPIAQEMGKLQKVQLLRISRDLPGAEQLGRSYLEAGFPQDKYGAEFTLLYMLGRIKGTQQQEDAALDYYLRALRCVTRAPELLAYTYYRIAVIAAHKKDKALLTWAGSNAIKADALNKDRDGMQGMISRLTI
ncbi:M1 family aminopeptidase [Chitinophaga nivalis]|uniref:M1 family aminopeptidase n=1 Tax=Chitinophaga nivalis TaxID=2991709 RepID=A0ABT3IJG5_9BACT|nr:M1 family aminopeptidase [Chitinophaga nivalis]MCW3466216.1 M1 family aminopeptidase [Chitinophaga nivalis]MCW3484093.1 M1 family aminopeptidase [Chitinophaga nivalis]